ncbi:hypothetical protein MLPF_1931 [Mycobacterium lepromatosis]|nr:hypothetical protein MLPF_1931 [Mycobacterium lepromatosis]
MTQASRKAGSALTRYCMTGVCRMSQAIFVSIVFQTGGGYGSANEQLHAILTMSPSPGDPVVAKCAFSVSQGASLSSMCTVE